MCPDHGTPAEPVTNYRPGTTGWVVNRTMITVTRMIMEPTATARRRERCRAPCAPTWSQPPHGAQCSVTCERAPVLRQGPFTADLTPHLRHPRARRVPRTPAAGLRVGVAGRAGPRAPRRRGPARGPGTYP